MGGLFIGPLPRTPLSHGWESETPQCHNDIAILEMLTVDCL